MDKSIIERFNRLYIIDSRNGCWLWTGHIAGSGLGYGYIKIGGTYFYNGHRSCKECRRAANRRWKKK